MVKRTVAALREDLLVLLEKMVAINSYSHNAAGIVQVAELVRQALPSPLALESAKDTTEGTLWLCGHGPAGEPPILLVGHLDTVYAPDTFDKGVDLQGDYLLGPGVADMKGGLVVIVGALWALDRLNVLPVIPLLLAFNGDEEIGSPTSGEILTELARSSRLGLVFECGGPEGTVVTSRRGLHRYRLEIRGETGHAGNQLGDKKSALVELAHRILDLEALNDPEAGLSVNVGRASGGSAANVIPGRAEAEFEVRFSEQRQSDEIEERIRALTNSPYHSSLVVQATRSHSRPVMARTPDAARLYQEAVRVARGIQISLSEESRGGASDANLLAASGLPTIDGLGPVGEMDHSENERILKDSLFQRVELLVHLLWNL
ncbi:MAG: M20 family metallopeptidase [Deltaproteobacteria bacterium]|nr:MAG: M20 family metallopeptidase [Deltaproteobacteria bacterium]